MSRASDPAVSVRARALRRQFPAAGWRGLLGEKRGGIRAFDLELCPGECVVLLGSNGSGKTTALRCLAGLERPDAGTVEVLGGSPFEPAIRRAIGYVPETSPLAPERTGRAFLEELAYLGGMERRERKRRCGELLERFGMSEHADRSARGYSKGQLRRVVLAQAFLRPQRVLLFDEPTSGLDAPGMLLWQELLDEARRGGAAIALCSHWGSEALELGDRALVLENGAVLREAPIAELFADPEVQELVVRGMRPADLLALGEEIARRGGELLSSGPRRRPLREVLREIVRP
ncbi:MAG: ABC transporter ATP-binding protein [Planctomycetes bacterium]|nr:ABC transporter ATP-binding protein [Planctomycetota bacterium]